MISEVVKKSKFKRQWTPTHTLTRAYSGALGRGLDTMDTAKMLRALGEEILKRSRAQIRQMAFSGPAKKLLSRALRLTETPRGIRIEVRDPVWHYLMDGQRKGPMRWLKKARRPIPIVTDTGDVIFRQATARSIKNGGWRHPGRSPISFIEQVKQEARAVIHKRLAKDLVTKLERTIG